MIDLKDGGVKSRKLWFTVFAILTCIASGLIAAKWAAFLPALETVVGAIVALSGLYLTGNVMAKWTLGKTAQKLEAAKPPDEQEVDK